LAQRTERDCGVSVFAALAAIVEEQLCCELPQAQSGDVTVAQWVERLRKKGFTVAERDGCPSDSLKSTDRTENAETY
jgi:hypothetical protein